MVPPPLFHGGVSAGGGTSAISGVGGATPMLLTNMAGPCSGQTPGRTAVWTPGAATNGDLPPLRCGSCGSDEEGSCEGGCRRARDELCPAACSGEGLRHGVRES
ncbi:unnamed protein product [Miscanthus lutarioriparius]|uniref:Uncharacterized protein n=1 Tax=Miscanthus lutarioriparius TaxID=422564 RepID=A0A811Q940_9POAL|nr:unnamed protein product [Miscanthus lutarioriparius]